VKTPTPVTSTNEEKGSGEPIQAGGTAAPVVPKVVRQPLIGKGHVHLGRARFHLISPQREGTLVPGVLGLLGPVWGFPEAALVTVAS
jgi:hypothetical protein